ncbi:hypothetical protein GO013_08625 [Pseudodesulfovibrio sp. JC047]|uniref:hypothetical protein n=1 Tax=Pseudodesulfovibrio sp. JC047 TaxID=2683199 RepID=UPI0013D431F8|nr:hypothetical protein [Pseudodesulfovibrio sp. JC047]NDV19480.1 hypothetical protein [Pseudodesulfovibrio sp. JC047]
MNQFDVFSWFDKKFRMLIYVWGMKYYLERYSECESWRSVKILLQVCAYTVVAVAFVPGL